MRNCPLVVPLLAFMIILGLYTARCEQEEWGAIKRGGIFEKRATRECLKCKQRQIPEPRPCKYYIHICRESPKLKLEGLNLVVCVEYLPKNGETNGTCIPIPEGEINEKCRTKYGFPDWVKIVGNNRTEEQC